MTSQFWKHLDELCHEYNENGKFITIPGYEWSGNTSLGGDRNVFFPCEGRTIRRSSHALVSDRSDLDTDCNSAEDLFSAFARGNEADVIMYAHCGGRYADIELAHDGRFEKSMEIFDAVGIGKDVRDRSGNVEHWRQWAWCSAARWGPTTSSGTMTKSS